MAFSPFYTVIDKDTGVELTELFSSIEHEECLDKDDLVTFQIDGAPISTCDNPSLLKGRIWLFNYGFIGGDISKTHSCQLTKTNYKYDGGKIKISITAKDLGYSARKISGTTVYKNKKASDVAKDIASQLELQTEIEESSKVYDIIPLGNRTWNQLLQDLAKSEPIQQSDTKGVWEFSINGDTLRFARRDYSIQSKRTFIYSPSNDTISELGFEFKDDSKGFELASNGVDKETGEPFNSKVSTDKNKEATTGDHNLNFDVNANLKQGIADAANLVKGTATAAPADNKDEADGKNASLLASGTGEMTVELVTPLDPTAHAGDIITITSVAKMHAGNWRITEVKHSITGSGALTTRHGSRNGAIGTAADGNNKNAGDANKTSGAKDGQTSKTVPQYNFNVNGQQL